MVDVWVPWFCVSLKWLHCSMRISGPRGSVKLFQGSARPSRTRGGSVCPGARTRIGLSLGWTMSTPSGQPRPSSWGGCYCSCPAARAASSLWGIPPSPNTSGSRGSAMNCSGIGRANFLTESGCPGSACWCVPGAKCDGIAWQIRKALQWENRNFDAFLLCGGWNQTWGCPRELAEILTSAAS